MKTDVEKAIQVIKAGGVIAYPTETVYGLGASVFNDNAIRRIYRIKKRLATKGLLVATSNIDQIETISFINKTAKKIIENFLPGPLTIILFKKEIISNELTGNKDTIGIRIPDNKFALEIIEKTGPITSTSANISNKPPAKNALDVREQLGDSVDYIFDGGECKSGLPSTILDISDENLPRILRKGNIEKETLENFLGKKILEV